MISDDAQVVYDNLALELRRGVLVLAVLSQLRSEQYGYSLKQGLDALGLEINEGTLYPLLRRLESQGLLESDWQVVDDTRPRRYYKMSQEGEMVYANLVQEWQALGVVMDQLLGLKKK
jgi:PadR family transcriptional regulator, regulatory protein PadR